MPKLVESADACDEHEHCIRAVTVEARRHPQGLCPPGVWHAWYLGGRRWRLWGPIDEPFDTEPASSLDSSEAEFAELIPYLGSAVVTDIHRKVLFPP